MRNVFFPTSIIDGFFEDPDSVRKFALELEYNNVKDNYYPGKRTALLHEINPLFFDSVANRFLNLFFSPNDRFSWKCMMYFQLIDSSYGSGWVHRDKPSTATALIYLTPPTEIDIGTTLYDKNNILVDPTSIQEPIFNQNVDDTLERNENNKHFKEVVKVSGLYNRGLIFDSHLYHASQNFVGDEKKSSRLTLIAFFYDINCGQSFFPIQRIQQRALTIL